MALTRKEKEVMTVVYETCEGRDSCLITPDELMSRFPEKTKISLNELNKILKLLELDDYFDIIYSEKKGETVLCITLHTKGSAFHRDKQQQKRYIYYRVALTVGLAVVSFVVGIILKKIFGG